GFVRRRGGPVHHAGTGVVVHHVHGVTHRTADEVLPGQGDLRGDDLAVGPTHAGVLGDDAQLAAGAEFGRRWAGAGGPPFLVDRTCGWHHRLPFCNCCLGCEVEQIRFRGICCDADDRVSGCRYVSTFSTVARHGFRWRAPNVEPPEWSPRRFTQRRTAAATGSSR